MSQRGEARQSVAGLNGEVSTNKTSLGVTTFVLIQRGGTIMERHEWESEQVRYATRGFEGAASIRHSLLN